jgi:hypothetical protein
MQLIGSMHAWAERHGVVGFHDSVRRTKGCVHVAALQGSRQRAAVQGGAHAFVELGRADPVVRRGLESNRELVGRLLGLPPAACDDDRTVGYGHHRNHTGHAAHAGRIHRLDFGAKHRGQAHRAMQHAGCLHIDRVEGAARDLVGCVDPAHGLAGELALFRRSQNRRLRHGQHGRRLHQIAKGHTPAARRMDDVAVFGVKGRRWHRQSLGCGQGQ